MSEMNRCGEWLSGEGPESDIVISTRIRLARNLDDQPFLSRTSPEQRTAIERGLAEAIRKRFGERLEYQNLCELSPVDRLCLVEKHLISKDHASSDGDRGVAFDDQGRVSILVNEEDHLRLQVIRSGLNFDEAWEQIDRIDDALENDVAYAFSSDFGYLTACPSNVGTGVRVSVMLHLPALAMTKQIEKVFVSVQQRQHAVRGLYGEGTHPLGDFYQISNQVTLGRSEAEILGIVRDLVSQIIDYERDVRKNLIKEKSVTLADRVWRALGILKAARLIDSEETMDLLSAVRLGIHTGLIPDIETTLVNELFVLIQPGHLQKLEARKLETPERDIVRANLIRDKLASVT